MSLLDSSVVGYHKLSLFCQHVSTCGAPQWLSMVSIKANLKRHHTYLARPDHDLVDFESHQKTFCLLNVLPSGSLAPSLFHLLFDGFSKILNQPNRRHLFRVTQRKPPFVGVSNLKAPVFLIPPKQPPQFPPPNSPPIPPPTPPSVAQSRPF